MKKDESKSVRKNWNNLLNDCCPLCDYRIKKVERLDPMFPNVKTGQWRCENPQCDFKIGDAKKRDMVEQISTELVAAGDDDAPTIQYGDVDDEMARQSELNNLRW